MTEWISVKDRLPPLNEWILVFCDSSYSEKKIHVGKMEIDGNTCEIGYNPKDYYGNWIAIFSHWMPLPEAPKEEI